MITCGSILLSQLGPMSHSAMADYFLPSRYLTSSWPFDSFTTSNPAGLQYVAQRFTRVRTSNLFESRKQPKSAQDDRKRE